MLTKTKKVALLTTGLAGSLLATTVAGVALSSCTFQVVDSSSSGSSADNPLINDNAAWYTNSINWNDAAQVSTLVIDDQGLVYANPAKTELIGTVPNTTISNLTIPASVRSITGYMDKTANQNTGTAKGAFQDMVSLTSVTFASNTTTRLGAQAFKGCTNLASVSLPPVLNSIGQSAFENCYNLSSINLNNVTYVGNSAFKLAFSGIPTATATADLNSAVYIGDNAFEGSTGLKSIDLSKNTNLHTIGQAAFKGNMFASIDFSKATKLLQLNATLFENCAALTDVNLPDSIATIKTNAFIGTTSLETVKLPAGLTALEQDVFGTKGGSNPSGLKTIDLSNTKLTQIHQKTFSGATHLQNISFPTNLTSIGSNAFDGCSSLTTVDLSNTKVTALSPYAFANTTSLRSITFPETLTNIGNNAFRNTTSLTSINIPNSVTSIDSFAFLSSSIENIDLSNTSIKALNADTFASSKLRSIKLPSTVTAIQQSAFLNSQLESISFAAPSSDTSRNTASSRSVDFTNASGLTTIGTNAFNGTKITEINLSNTKVTSIGSTAFANNTSLTKVVLPTTLTTINNGAFSAASSLASITFASNSQSARAKRSVQPKNDETKLDFTNATSLTTIGNNVFNGTAITEANLSGLQLNNSSNDAIQNGLFANCEKLTKVTLPSGITQIPTNAFQNCSSLTTLSFGTAGANGQSGTLDFTNGTSITSIGASAFSGTAFSEINLTKLPATLSVGADAFSSIVGLTSVTLSEAQATTINPGVFSRSNTEGSGQETFTISLQGGSGSSNTIQFGPEAFGSSNVTLTPFSNLNRFDASIKTFDLSASPITTLSGGVLWGNESITTLKLPATASSWKLTDPKDYKSSPIGYTSENASNGLLTQSAGGLEFLNFKNDSTNSPASTFGDINWTLVASILNMFGHVDGKDGKDTNLLAWKENFSGELTGEMLQSAIWDSVQTQRNSGSTKSPITDKTTSATLTVNNLTWTYKNSGNSITLTATTNLYRAGYTNNPYAYYQVGFAEKQGESGKIDHTKQVTITLKLVGN